MKENDVKPRTVFVGLDLYYSQKFVDEILDLITDLQNQLQQKENIIKEVREYLDIDESIRKNCKRYDVNGIAILEILDKNFKLEETSKISKLCINNELQYNLKEEKKIPEKLPIYDAYSKFDITDNRKAINEIIDYLKSKGE